MTTDTNIKIIVVVAIGLAVLAAASFGIWLSDFSFSSPARNAHWTDVDFETHGDHVLKPLGLQTDTTKVEGEPDRVVARVEIWHCLTCERRIAIPIPRYILGTADQTFLMASKARPIIP